MKFTKNYKNLRDCDIDNNDGLPYNHIANKFEKGWFEKVGLNKDRELVVVERLTMLL